MTNDANSEPVRERNRRELFDRMRAADEKPDTFVALRELGGE